MALDPLAPRPSCRFLVVASTPTPNGRLHLGHIAGPFLRADVLVRHWRSRGHQVVFASGLDSYESYVLLRARQNGWNPRQVVDSFGSLIIHDLRALDVETDIWIDPCAQAWERRYQEVHRSLMARLIAAGGVAVHVAPVRYIAAEDRFLANCWLLGRCPNCSAEAAGSSCEVCSWHFPPYHMVDPRDRMGRTDLRDEVLDHLLLRMDYGPLEEYVGTVQVAEPFRQLGRQALADRNFHARLVTPGDWGVSWPRASARGGSVLFTYAFNLGFARLFGEAFQEQTGDSLHPFHPSSSVRLVATVGIDVLMPRLVILPAMAQLLGYRAYDRLVLNRFYTLSRQKFSTSRGHAIWAEDIITRTPACSDAVRYYLAHTSPDVVERDFDPADFVRVNNGLAAALRERCAPIALDGPFPAPLLALLRELIAEQDAVVEQEPLCLPRYVSVLERWLAAWEAARPTASWWLRGWALLSWPVMPRLAGAVWTRLGHVGVPEVQRFFEPAGAEIADGDVAAVLPRELDLGQLAACLPVTLQTQ